MTYNRSFYAKRAARADADAKLSVPEVSLTLGKCPATVLDVGCGDGAWLRWWQTMGATGLVGIDPHGPDDWTRKTGGIHARLDLSDPFDLGQRFDLVQCLEVAEHLPPEAADTIVDSLCRHGDRILFSAAHPGQGGTGHINEQPIEYWAEKFAARGYVAQDLIRHRLHPLVSPWFRQNMILFCKEERRIVFPKTKLCMARYRDSFAEVHDAVAELTKSPLIPRLYGTTPMAIHELAYDAIAEKMRSAIASETIVNPYWAEFEYSLWIDADQSFRPQQAIDLVIATAANGWDIASGIYVTKGANPRIVHRVNDDTRLAPMGPYARPYTIDGIGFGFCVVRNSLYARMVEDPRAKVRRAWLGNGQFMWDLFRTFVSDTNDNWLDPLTGVLCGGWWSEDTAFSERAIACGVDIWIQPQICVGHIGRRVYTVQDLKEVAQ